MAATKSSDFSPNLLLGLLPPQWGLSPSCTSDLNSQHFLLSIHDGHTNFIDSGVSLNRHRHCSHGSKFNQVVDWEQSP